LLAALDGDALTKRAVRRFDRATRFVERNAFQASNGSPFAIDVVTIGKPLPRRPEGHTCRDRRYRGNQQFSGTAEFDTGPGPIYRTHGPP
jgi:hypothetical protein